jgi:hypothetical protein
MLFSSPRFLLVLRPLLQRKANSLLTTPLIVIDALDECEKESDIRHILQLLRNVQSVRISRDLPVRDAFSHLLPIIRHSIIYGHIGVVDYWQSFAFWDGLFLQPSRIFGAPAHTSHLPPPSCPGQHRGRRDCGPCPASTCARLPTPSPFLAVPAYTSPPPPPSCPDPCRGRRDALSRDSWRGQRRRLFARSTDYMSTCELGPIMSCVCPSLKLFRG